MIKLKYREVGVHRAQLLQDQQQRCALCNDIVIDDAVLDHDHKTGLIRCVLHRGCNSMLGKIENNMPRSKLDIDRLEKFAKNLVEYIKKEHSSFLHPTHKTHIEKLMKKKKGGGRGKGRGR